MKKSIISVLCAALLMTVIAIPGMGAEVSEEMQSEEGTLDDSVFFDGPFEMTDDEGRHVIGYEISNATEDAVYAGMVVEFFDSSGADIGISSAYVPCIGPGEKTFIYAANYFDEDYAAFSSQTTEGLAGYTSAIDDLVILNIVENDGRLTCTAENDSSEDILLPQITVVYMMNSEPTTVSTGMLKEDGNTELYLNSGQTGTVDIACPEEYDDYYFYTTAMFGETGESEIGTDCISAWILE